MAKHQKNMLTRTVEAPAELLERTVATSSHLAEQVESNALVKKTGSYWRMLGPGLTTGASDDDPSGIATYSQVGAGYGFQYLWLSIVTFPLMSTVQEMCARIGLVTGRGLAGNIRVHFPKPMLYGCALLLFVANAVNIGANLGAMAAAVQLLNPKLSFALLVIGFGLASLLLQIFTPYVRYAKYLKWLAFVLFSYVLSALLAHLDWGDVLRHAVVPTLNFDKQGLFLLCAILGTTISPYLFFWQTSQEVEEEILAGKTTVRQRSMATPKADIKGMRIDVWNGMFLSNMVMFFIIAACGGVLYANNITEITSAAQAATALRPFAGNATFFLFAIGIIGTGLLSLPVLAGSSSYAVCETLRWKEGLYRNLGKESRAFYGIIIISMLIGMAINFLGIDPFQALIYAAVANGLVAPIVLFFIVRLSSNRDIMGHWTNKRSTTAVGWLTTAVMALAGLAAIWSLF